MWSLSCRQVAVVVMTLWLLLLLFAPPATSESYTARNMYQRRTDTDKSTNSGGNSWMKWLYSWFSDTSKNGAKSNASYQDRPQQSSYGEKYNKGSVYGNQLEKGTGSAKHRSPANYEIHNYFIHQETPFKEDVNHVHKDNGLSSYSIHLPHQRTITTHIPNTNFGKFLSQHRYQPFESNLISPYNIPDNFQSYGPLSPIRITSSPMQYTLQEHRPPYKGKGMS